MENDYKEVYFYKYCETCKHSGNKETDDPCYDCLSEPVNLNSHKPVYWESQDDSRE